jgi:branched-chain amino acid transport system ATP-binding protein
MTILVAEHVSRNFGGIRAIENLSFALKEGEIVALIGPNGAGKTTLVNLLTGVLRPSSGTIRFQGEDVTAQRPFEAARRGLARTFQIVQPFPKMTVLENVAAAALFGGKQASVTAATVAAREQLEFTGLTPFADRSAAALTLAGRKRLELAKSMAMNPSVTILVIEHLMKVVMSLAQRVLVLHHGQLIAEGSAHEIVRNQRVVEAYLGEKFARRFTAEAANG